jgi:hypothetical protein
MFRVDGGSDLMVVVTGLDHRIAVWSDTNHNPNMMVEASNSAHDRTHNR